MKISLLLDVPTPPPRGSDCPSLEERVRHACDCIETQSTSPREWDFIRRLNNWLQTEARKRTLRPRERAVLLSLQPVIEKYGLIDPRGVELDAEWRTARHPQPPPGGSMSDIDHG